VTDSEKTNSLLRYRFIYGRKEFYCTGSWPLTIDKHNLFFSFIKDPNISCAF